MLSTYTTIAIAALVASTAALPQRLVARQTNATTNGTTTSTDTDSFGIPPPADPISTEVAAANAALAKEAFLEITAVDRFKVLLTVDGAGEELLPQEELDARAKFNFNQAPEVGEGGRFLLANQKSMPLLVDQGISTAVGFLDACSMNAPHSHPRATEFLTVVQGRVQSGMMLEDGFLPNSDNGRSQQTTEVQVQLNAFEGTVFPMGSIHYQFNPTCDPATFVASLNSADPGTSRTAQNFFFLDEEIVDIVLGGVQVIDSQNIAEFGDTIPANLVTDMENCMRTCNM